MGHEQIMQPTGAGQSDLIGGIEHTGGIAQQLSGVIDRKRLKEGFRAEASPPHEQALEMGSAHAVSFR